jgi:mannose-6-phosphate isomerase-like protein (cupin superfamily)
MPVSIERKVFSGMDGAYDQLKARKLWPVMAVHPSMHREAPHWHKQNNQIFVVEGVATFYDEETGQGFELTSGDICVIPSGSLHAAEAEGRVVLIAAFDHAMSMTEFKPYPPEDRP